MDIKTQYNQIGENYINGKKSFFSDREDWGHCRMISLLHDLKGKVLLDVGCGDGGDALEYVNMGAKVICIDPSDYMVTKAKENLGKLANVLSGDFEKIPVEDSSVDVITGRYSMHYLVSFDKAYSEIYRVLKPGGVVVLLLPHPTGDFFMKKEMIGDREVVCVPLYGGQVVVKYHKHSFADYFSDTFIKLFKLESYSEFTQAETDKEIKVPTAFVIKFSKK